MLVKRKCFAGNSSGELERLPRVFYVNLHSERRKNQLISFEVLLHIIRDETGSFFFHFENEIFPAIALTSFGGAQANTQRAKRGSKKVISSEKFANHKSRFGLLRTESN